MAIKPVEKRFFYHRGMNDLSDLKRIEDDHVSNLQNFDIVPVSNGGTHLEMRGGNSKKTMTSSLGSNPILGVVVANHTAGDEIIFGYTTILKKLAATPTNVATGRTAAMNDFVMFQDVLIAANGTDVLAEKAAAGSFSTLAGTPPVAKYLAVWHNYIWTAGTAGSLNRLRWCDIGDKDTWSAGNIQDFPYGTITGLGALDQTFYIFFEDHIQKLTGYTASDFVFTEFKEKGCISHYGIASNGDTLFFPARDGFYAIGALGATDKVVGGSSLVKLSSEKLQTFWKTLDISSRDLIHGEHDAGNHRIMWSVRRQNETANDREVFFDYEENVIGFGLNTGIYASCYALNKDTNGFYELIYGDSRSTADGGLLRVHDTSKSDDGTAIDAQISTKAYDFGQPDVLKKFISVDILVRGTASEATMDVHYGVGEFPGFTDKKTINTSPLPVYGTAIYGQDKYTRDTFKNYNVAIRKTGKSMVLKFVCDTLNEGVKIAGWTINAQLLKKRNTTTV